VNVEPAALIVAERPGPLVDATAKFTVPLPMFDDDVIVTHDWSLVAVHGHPVPAVTVIDPVPPEAGKD
jgi:hypothetical protein